MKTKYLSRRESRELSGRLPRELKDLYDYELEPVVRIEATQRYSLILCKKGAVIVEFKRGEFYVPSLTDSKTLSRIKHYVVVDKDAVRFIVNGANVMRPGVISYSDFKANSMVTVKEPLYKRVIAIGYSTIEGGKLNEIKKGVVVRNVHHLRDPAWNAIKSPEVQSILGSLV